MLQIAVLISGGGSNLQSLIDRSELADEATFQICAVISDREAAGLQRAEKSGIPSFLIDRKMGYRQLSEEINLKLEGKADFIVLAGFLSILDESFIEKWKNKIINIHPALLPKYGGKGMYGMNVHKAVIQAGDKKSGCTVHYVDSGIDTGEIISQMSLDVEDDWDEVKLQKEVLKLEHILLPQTVDLLCRREENK